MAIRLTDYSVQRPQELTPAANIITRNLDRIAAAISSIQDVLRGEKFLTFGQRRTDGGAIVTAGAGIGIELVGDLLRTSFTGTGGEEFISYAINTTPSLQNGATRFVNILGTEGLTAAPVDAIGGTAIGNNAPYPVAPPPDVGYVQFNSGAVAGNYINVVSRGQDYPGSTATAGTFAIAQRVRIASTVDANTTMGFQAYGPTVAMSIKFGAIGSLSTTNFSVYSSGGGSLVTKHAIDTNWHSIGIIREPGNCRLYFDGEVYSIPDKYGNGVSGRCSAVARHDVTGANKTFDLAWMASVGLIN